MTTDVLIIGAGLSGLEAARLLHQNNIGTIVLEGRDRIGGRIWSVKSKNDHVFDLGAAWIHGINGSIPGGLLTNPLWDLVQQTKIETRGTLQNNLQIFYPTNETNFDVQTWYGEYLLYVRERIRLPESNATLKYYANAFVNLKNFTEHQKQAFYSYLHFAIESYEGAELDVIGGKGFFDITSIHYGEEHVFHRTGYVSLIEYLAKDVKDIRLQQIVTKISYGADLAEVQTANGQTYQAKFVLVTVPLGVLKGRSIDFSPSLPQWKMDAIDRLGFGMLDKAVLLWNKAWWNSTDYYFLRVSAKPTEFGYWINANKWNDKPAIICYFVGKEAYRLETTVNKSEVIEQVRQTLQDMFPDRIVPTPIDSLMTYWKLDPFSNGSYSYVSVNQRYEDPSYLAQPIQNQLLFAGEATSTDSYGYAHGALMSARREVTRLLYVYNLLQNPTPSSFAMFSPDPSMIVLIAVLTCLKYL
ncbi:unnamed protein product [Rotaria sp. Silwood1]|nr:unnamed protein product [Rotaria sp. Silwood1]